MMFNFWVISLSTHNWGIIFHVDSSFRTDHVCFILQVLITIKGIYGLKCQMWCAMIIYERVSQDSQEKVTCVTTDTGQAYALDQSSCLHGSDTQAAGIIVAQVLTCFETMLHSILLV